MSIAADDFLETVVSIEELENVINKIEVSIEQISYHKDKLENMDSIIKIAKKDSMVTSGVISMLNIGIESSLLTLGLPTDDLVKDNTLFGSLEAKNILVEKMKVVIIKLYTKLKTIMRKMLMKVITTVNFNKKSLDNIAKSLKEGKTIDHPTFSDKEANSLGKKFATLAVLKGKTLKFEIKDINNTDGFSSLLNKLNDINEKDDNVNLFLKMLKSDETKHSKNKWFKDNVDAFEIKDHYKDLVRVDTASKQVLRYDGSNITILMMSKVSSIQLLNVGTFSVRKEILERITFAKVPTVKEMLEIVESTSRTNDDIKNFINHAFDKIDKVSNNVDKSIERLKNANSEKSAKDDLSQLKSLLLTSPKIVTAEVMGHYKMIRNIITLGNAVVKVRELDK